MSGMTREQRDMAVAVAKDAILQLRLPEGAPTMRMMTYFCAIVPAGVDLPKGDEDLQSHIDSLQPYCHVCQVGLMFLSMVRLYDNAPASLLAGHGDRHLMVKPGDMRSLLNPVFGDDSVKLMEHAFEGFSQDYDDYFGTYHRPNERAIAILENVIANDGEFVVEGGAGVDEDPDYYCGDDEEDDDEAA